MTKPSAPPKNPSNRHVKLRRMWSVCQIFGHDIPLEAPPQTACRRCGFVWGP